MSTSTELDDPRHIAGEPAPQTSGKPVPPLSETRTQVGGPRALQSRPKRILAVLQVLMLIGAIGASSYAMYTVATWPSDSDDMDSNQNELLVRTEGRDGKAVSEMLEAFARFVDKSFADSTGRLRGPAPAIVERIRGKSRWALLITHTNRARLHEVIRLARTSIECPSTIRLIIDIDPIDLM